MEFVPSTILEAAGKVLPSGVKKLFVLRRACDLGQRSMRR